MLARWLLMPLLLALQACSGTTFGQKLADSFDSPPKPAAAQPTLKEPAKAEDQSLKDQTTSDSEAEVEPTDSSEPKTTKKELTKVATKESAPVRRMPADPRPYRITIRLAAADPAAPAESVTDALRRAGIGFEVETIEKIPSRQASKEATNDSERQP